MMQVTVRRFREFWPDAEIHVLNDDPELLELYCPSAVALNPAGQQYYYTTAAYLTSAGQRFSSSALSELDVSWRHAFPDTVERLVASRNGAASTSAIREFLELVRSCDLVVASGAGQITTENGEQEGR